MKLQGRLLAIIIGNRGQNVKLLLAYVGHNGGGVKVKYIVPPYARRWENRIQPGGEHKVLLLICVVKKVFDPGNAALQPRCNRGVYQARFSRGV